MWTAASRGLTSPSRERRAKGALPRLAHRILDLARRLVQVHVYRDVELPGQVADPFERLVAHRVRGVRRERGVHEALVAERLVHFEPAGEVRRRVPGPRGRNLEDDETEHGPDPRLAGDLSCHVRKKVHVVETGGSATQHLRRGEARPGAHEPLVHETGLGRPDVLGEPGFERKSSARPRNRVIAAWVWALTNPGTRPARRGAGAREGRTSCRPRPPARARRWSRPAPRGRVLRGRTRPAPPERSTRRSIRGPLAPGVPWGGF